MGGCFCNGTFTVMMRKTFTIESDSAKGGDVMIEPNDWRLIIPKEYLKGETLLHKNWVSVQPDWDHDHCKFCGDKVDASTPDKWYCTTDEYYWICENCFNDFKDMFHWKVIEE
jgi:hypothetical protein